MPDCVFDSSFVAKANGPVEAEKAGNFLHRRLDAMRSVTSGERRLRYNPKLLSEYSALIQQSRNDVLDQFLELLDNERTVRLKNSTLRRADKVKANKCRWPTHDQHVLAAAIDGEEVVIHVTETALGVCRAAVRRVFGFSINYIA